MFDLRNFDSSGGKQMVLIKCQVLSELIKKDNLFRTPLFYNVYYYYLFFETSLSEKSSIFKETFNQVVA